MKRSKNLLEQLKTLPHFSKNIVCQMGNQLGLEDSTVNTYISRFLKCKEIIQLKRGLYISADFFENNKNDASSSFFLANIIRTPSYVSSWAALQYCNLPTEAIHSITSVTPKVTREYQTRAGHVSYQSIQDKLSSDFFWVKGKFGFFIASPSKALFDLLYFRTNQFRSRSGRDIQALIRELRIDIEEMDKTEQGKFYALVKKYAKGAQV